MRTLSSRRPGTIARIVVAAMLAGCLLGAGSVARAQHTANRVTVTYWQQWTDPVQKAAMMKVIRLFEKTYPNINIQEVDISSDQKILTAITGGKPPDAASLWNLADLGEWASRGALQNIDPLAQTYHTDLGSYTPSALDTARYNHHLYGLPIEVDDNGLYINTDVFRAAKITRYPTTMSQLENLAIKLTKRDSSGRITQLGFGPIIFAFWPGVINLAPAFGGSWYSAQTHTVTPDNPDVVRALTWEKSLIDKIGAQAYSNFAHSKAHNSIGDLFLDGHVAMAIDGEFGCSLFPKYNKNLHWTVVPLPYQDGHPEWKDGTTLGGSINVIPTGAAHPGQAYQFIQFIDSTRAQIILNSAWGNIPSVKAAGNALSHGCLGQFIRWSQGTNAAPWPVLPIANDYQTAVNAAEDFVLHGKQAPGTAMAQVKQKIQAQLTSH
jgi:multiple sugar transport system substrate-binding protein